MNKSKSNSDSRKSLSRTHPKYKNSRDTCKKDKYYKICANKGKPLCIVTNHNTEECNYHPDKFKEQYQKSLKAYKKMEKEDDSLSSPDSSASEKSWEYLLNSQQKVKEDGIHHSRASSRKPNKKQRV